MRLREGGGAEPRRFTASQWRPVSLLAHITAIFTHVIAILPAHVIGSSHGGQRLSDRQTGAASFRLLDRRRRQDHRGSHRHRPRWPFHPLQVAGHVQSHGSLPRHGVPSHNGELDGSQRRSESGSRLHDHCRTDIADSAQYLPSSFDRFSCLRRNRDYARSRPNHLGTLEEYSAYSSGKVRRSAFSSAGICNRSMRSAKQAAGSHAHGPRRTA